MGCQQGPAWMTQCVEATFVGMSGRTVLPYLDDVATPCADFVFDQGIARLRAILERISWANLSISAPKLRCFATEM